MAAPVAMAATAATEAHGAEVVVEVVTEADVVEVVEAVKAVEWQDPIGERVWHRRCSSSDMPTGHSRCHQMHKSQTNRHRSRRVPLFGEVHTFAPPP